MVTVSIKSLPFTVKTIVTKQINLTLISKSITPVGTSTTSHENKTNQLLTTETIHIVHNKKIDLEW